MCIPYNGKLTACCSVFKKLELTHTHMQTGRQTSTFIHMHPCCVLTNKHILKWMRAHTTAGPHCAHTLSHRPGHADALKAFNSTQRSSLKPSLRLSPPCVCGHVSVCTWVCPLLLWSLSCPKGMFCSWMGAWHLGKSHLL